MKKIFGLFLFIFTCLLFTGCANPQVSQQTPQQIASEVCIPVQAALTVLQAPGILDVKLAAELDVIVPLVNSVCNAGQVIDVSNFHNLATTGLPAILKIVAVAPIPERDKQIATIGIAVAQAACSSIIAQNTVPISPTPVVIPVVTPSQTTVK